MSRLIAVVKDPRTLLGIGVNVAALGLVTYGAASTIADLIREIDRDVLSLAEQRALGELVDAELVDEDAAPAGYCAHACPVCLKDHWMPLTGAPMICLGCGSALRVDPMGRLWIRVRDRAEDSVQTNGVSPV